MTPAAPAAPAAPGPLPRGRVVVLVGVAFALLFARSMNRHFDHDEHQFVAPPVLLHDSGLLPYVDYPYFHMPTLPGVYAGVVGWCPYKLLAARLLSAACGTATVALLFAACWRLFAALPPGPRWRLAGSLALVFFCSRLFTYTSGLAWNHDPSMCCALAAVLLHLRGLRLGRAWYGLAAGLLLGTAVGVRLSFALAVVPFALTAAFGPSLLTTRQRAGYVAAGVVGVAAALAPAVVLLARAPADFVFGNLRYVGLNTLFFAASEPASVRPFESWFRMARAFASDPGNAALAGCFLYAVGRRLGAARAWRGPHAADVLVPLAVLPFLLVGVMGPNPQMYQYPYMLLPFVTLAVAAVVAAEAADPAMVRHWVRVLTVCAVVSAATGLPRWYWPVVFLPTPERWVPVHVHRVGEWVRENTRAGDRVLTIDPVVPLEGGVAVYPEFAVGKFVNHVGPYMTPADRRRYRMAWGEELDRVLAGRPPDAILVDTRLLFLVGPFQMYAEAHGYLRHDCPLGDYVLWTRPER